MDLAALLGKEHGVYGPYTEQPRATRKEIDSRCAIGRAAASLII